MIDRNLIIQLIEDKLGKDQFIVDVTVGQANKINVVLDSETGISIDDCIKISRQIEGSLDREEEDFELEVSSAGLGQPFRTHRQYIKNLGAEVEVIFTNGQKQSGILRQADGSGFDLETTTKEKAEGKKKKELVTRMQRISFEETKTVKNIIKF
ncbi:MAG: ribosome assembly cofactor RimP [Prolixibacteraceae bacterium]